MNSLRFLLVHRDALQSERIASELASANHTVLPATGLEEASDALTVEQFDAILVESEFMRRGLAEFSARLRAMTNGRPFSVRVPVIAISVLGERGNHAESGVDAVIPEPIDPHAISDTVLRLAEAVSTASTTQLAAEHSALAVIEADKFNEQVGEDHELMIEIIDLFLEERKRQEPEMREALKSREFDKLSRLAHTIKGSLGSLHAAKSRQYAQDLELASKHSQEENCSATLSALEAALAELEPRLLSLRSGEGL